MYRIKMAGIYKIEHRSGFYYIGMSVDIFSRWQSHYTNMKIKKHSSVELMNLWNRTEQNEWTFSILEQVSLTEYKKTYELKGKVLESGFRRLLLNKEKNWMALHSVNYCLNKDKKNFT